MPDLTHVPPVYGGERGRDIVPSVEATARNVRWQRRAGRYTVAAVLLLAWLAVTRLNMTAQGQDPWWWTDVPMLALAAWWATGMFGLRRSVTMGAAMAAAVAPGMATWRAMPQPDRAKAEPLARGLLAAGARHDLDGVFLRLTTMDRAARAAAEQQPGWNRDVEEAEAWISASREARSRGPYGA